MRSPCALGRKRDATDCAMPHDMCGRPWARVPRAIRARAAVLSSWGWPAARHRIGWHNNIQESGEGRIAPQRHCPWVRPRTTDGAKLMTGANPVNRRVHHRHRHMRAHVPIGTHCLRNLERTCGRAWRTSWRRHMPCGSLQVEDQALSRLAAPTPAHASAAVVPYGPWLLLPVSSLRSPPPPGGAAPQPPPADLGPHSMRLWACTAFRVHPPVPHVNTPPSKSP